MKRKMDWKVIGILSVIGVIMGLLSVKGFTQKLEPFLWLLFGIATALIISKNITEKTFLHGLFIGLAWGTINGVIQSMFFDTYLANNPALQENFSKSTSIQPRYLVLLTSPVFGLMTGAVIGGLSLLLRRIW